MVLNTLNIMKNMAKTNCAENINLPKFETCQHLDVLTH